MSDFRRRLRGAIKNTVVWGIGWTVLGFSTTLLLRMTGLIDAPVAVPDAVVFSLKVGVGGGIAGAAFSAFVAFAYRNRRLQDISWWKFGIGGAVVTAVSITGFVQGASLLGGSGLVPWRYLASTTAMFSVFGFGIAALSLKLAQMATLRAPHRAEGLLDQPLDAKLYLGEGSPPTARSSPAHSTHAAHVE